MKEADGSMPGNNSPDDKYVVRGRIIAWGAVFRAAAEIFGSTDKLSKQEQPIDETEVRSDTDEQ